MAIQANTVSFCIPIVADNLDKTKQYLESALKLKPDIIEFRRDSFSDLENEDSLHDLLKQVRDQGTEVIYTFRDYDEGGAQKIEDAERLKSIERALESEALDYLDVERASDEEYWDQIVDIIEQTPVRVITSSHNFNETPELQEVEKILEESIERGDIVKAAFRCENLFDLKSLIYAGEHFRRHHPKVPLVLIGMDRFGTLSRVSPELLESNLTFVTDKVSSAPGQVSLSEVLDLRNRLGLS